jgi:hypothetical protein
MSLQKRVKACVIKKALNGLKTLFDCFFVFMLGGTISVCEDCVCKMGVSALILRPKTRGNNLAYGK